MAGGENDEVRWRQLQEAEQSGRARDLADLRSGKRSAAQINDANRVVPDGGRLEFPADLSCLELDLDD